MRKSQPTIAIAGAGLSGLACARLLARAGLRFTLYEASSEVGGRVRSDKVDGFTLDRGFQLFLPAYPEARRVLDYEGLKLRPFYRGLDIFHKNRFHRLPDPFSHPLETLRHLGDDFISWRDRWFTLLMRKEAFSTHAVERRIVEMETEDYLRSFGFSEDFIDHFFRPFFGGAFLEKDLRTSVRVFLFLFSMFDKGGSAIPAHGMQAIPDQLAVALPPGSLRLNSPLASIRPGELTLETGEVVPADHIIVATSEEAAFRLLPSQSNDKLLPGRATTCLYFSTDQPLTNDPILYVDGDNRGPVNHACVISKISPDYAPPGQHLISASVVGAASSNELESVVREQMVRWFGPGAQSWRHLRTYQIRNAQPESRQLRVGDGPLPAVVSPGLYRCGDYCEDVSINGALLSGRRAAEAVISALGPLGT
ncbi:MAG: NAD(P)/FAD-dependent oxidoreductase [Prosthecobacter sp.]|nr:NAD(P)/FAD-dependent oxidoreductase [Prosthecobacter sp.]